MKLVRRPKKEIQGDPLREDDGPPPGTPTWTYVLGWDDHACDNLRLEGPIVHLGLY